jgi:hypothetical protein
MGISPFRNNSCNFIADMLSILEWTDVREASAMDLNDSLIGTAAAPFGCTPFSIRES